ncbi:MAG: hypothetical protein U5L76_02965 [Patescibacteria group bacterium]|nr:hypothetical protein [Patescibacteria group bacterium]
MNKENKWSKIDERLAKREERKSGSAFTEARSDKDEKAAVEKLQKRMAEMDRSILTMTPEELAADLSDPDIKKAAIEKIRKARNQFENEAQSLPEEELEKKKLFYTKTIEGIIRMAEKEEKKK